MIAKIEAGKNGVFVKIADSERGYWFSSIEQLREETAFARERDEYHQLMLLLGSQLDIDPELKATDAMLAEQVVK